MFKVPLVINVVRVEPESVLNQFIGAKLNAETADRALLALYQLRREAREIGWTDVSLQEDIILSDMHSQCVRIIKESQERDEEMRRTYRKFFNPNW